MELPLCEIKDKYEKLEGGKKLIADILKSRGLCCVPGALVDNAIVKC